MADLDVFVQSIVQPNLKPGEVLKGIGLATWYQKYNVWGNPTDAGTWYLAAATDRRLVLIKTRAKVGLTATTAEPLNLGIEVWSYADLASAETQWVSGLLNAMIVVLVPKAGLGPHGGEARKLFFQEKAAALDDPRRMARDFTRWLSENVAAQRFTADGLPPGSDPAPLAAPQRPAVYVPMPKARRGGTLALVALAGLLGLGALFSGYLANRALHAREMALHGVETLERRAAAETAAGQLATAEQSRRFQGDRQRDADRAQSRALLGGGGACTSFFLALAALGGAVALTARENRRHQAALAERARAMESPPAPFVG